MRCNPRHAQEECSEVPARGTFRIPPAPHEPLALHVNDTPLDDDPREDLAQDLCQAWIPIHGGARGNESLCPQTAEERAERRRSELVHAVCSSNDLVSYAIHHTKDARRPPFEEGAIRNEVRGTAEERCGHVRWTLQPFVDDALQLPPEVPTLDAELTERVSLFEPEEEPALFVDTPRFRLLPGERSFADAALETLRACSGLPEATYLVRWTE